MKDAMLVILYGGLCMVFGWMLAPLFPMGTPPSPTVVIDWRCAKYERNDCTRWFKTVRPINVADAD